MHFYFSCAPLVTFKVSVCSAFFIFVNNSLCFASIIASWLHAKYHHRYERRSGEQKQNKVVGIKQRKFVKCQLVVYVYCGTGILKTIPAMRCGARLFLVRFVQSHTVIYGRLMHTMSWTNDSQIQILFHLDCLAKQFFPLVFQYKQCSKFAYLFFLLNFRFYFVNCCI